MRKRKNYVMAYLDASENKRLCFLSEKMHLSKSDVIRQLLLTGEVREAAPIDYHKLIREVRIVGNNINHLLMIANAGGYYNALEIKTALEQLRETEQLIRSEFTKD